MALTRCPECGHYLSTKACLCPHCGCPRPPEGWPDTEADDRPKRVLAENRASPAEAVPDEAFTRFRVTQDHTAAPNSQRSDGLAIIAILTSFAVFVMILTTVGRIVGGVILLCVGLIEWRYPGKGVSLLIELMERSRPGVRAWVERSILGTTKARAIASAGLGISLLLISIVASALQLSTRVSTTESSVSITAAPARPPGVSMPHSSAEPSQRRPAASPQVQFANPLAATETPKLMPIDYALRGLHNPLKLCGKAVLEAPNIACYQTGATGTILCRTEESSFALEDALYNSRQDSSKAQTITDVRALGQLVKHNGCFTDDSSGILAVTPDFMKMYILNGKYQGQALYSRAPQWDWEICGGSTGKMNGTCPEIAPSWPSKLEVRFEPYRGLR
jgi:hypothetical protein